jgi:hypothetical protein
MVKRLKSSLSLDTVNKTIVDALIEGNISRKTSEMRDIRASLPLWQEL